MQAIFGEDPDLAAAFRGTISEARLARYKSDSNGDDLAALQLYHWNALLSQSLYLVIQIWEVSLRNKLNIFLARRYTDPNWPYNDRRTLRELQRPDKDRLIEARERQERARGLQRAPTDTVVADLSASFWVSLLTKSYEVTFSWRYNLSRVFPHDASLKRDTVSAMCDRILAIRNRIAHHEPIYHLSPDAVRADLEILLKAMCPGVHAYAQTVCTFAAIWEARPGSLVVRD